MLIQKGLDLSSRKSALAALSEGLKKVYEEDLDRPIEIPRVEQICLAEKYYLYYQGKQYLVPKADWGNRTMGWKVLTGPQNARKNMRFASVYNIIYSDGIKYQAVVSQKPQNVKCVADDPHDEEAKAAVLIADVAAKYLHQQWKIKGVAKDLSFHQWVTGPAFLRPRYVANGPRYGWQEEPQWTSETITEPAGFRCPDCGEKSASQQCSGCGMPIPPQNFEPPAQIEVPVEGEPKRYAKGGVELDIFSSLYVTVPFKAREIEECAWLRLATFDQKWQVRAQHSDKIDDLDSVGLPTDNSDMAALEAIEEIEAPNGSGVKNRDDTVLNEERWITPEVYYAFPLSIRKALLAQFPNGVKTTRIGEQFIDVQAAALIDDWDVCKTGTGEQIVSPPLSSYLIEPQNDINNLINMAKETVLRGIPRTLVHSNLLDDEAWQQKAMVGELIKVLPTEDLDKKVKQLHGANFPEQLLPLWQGMRTFTQETDGIQPVLFGGGQGFTTWRQAAQAKNMALMQLQPSSDEINACVARGTRKGIRVLKKMGTGKLSAPADKPNSFNHKEAIDVSSIKMEGWHIEPVETMPFSFGEKVQVIGELAKENPNLAVAVGLNHPNNISEVQQMFGIDTLYAPGENEREAALARIQQLLQETASDDIDPMTGKPIRVSSRPVRPFEDNNHALITEIFRTWCNSDSGRKAEQENPGGYENVTLHGQEQQQAGMAAMMPPQGGPPPSDGQAVAGSAAGGPSPESTLAPVDATTTGPIPPVDNEG